MTFTPKFQNPAEITPPALTALPHGLLVNVARPITESRWRGGVTFVPYGSDGLDRMVPEMCADDEIDSILGTEDCPTFGPFMVYGAEDGSTLDWTADDLAARVNDRFAVMLSEQIAAELFSSTESPSLNGSAYVIPGGPTSALASVAQVEAMLAMLLHGAEGIVWMAPGLLTVVAAQLRWDGSGYRTPAGHRVACDPGSFGQVPDGEVEDPATGWVYGTGPVLYQVGPPVETVGNAEQYLDRDRNTILAQRKQDAIVAFDPATVVAAEAFYSDAAGS